MFEKSPVAMLYNKRLLAGSMCADSWWSTCEEYDVEVLIAKMKMNMKNEMKIFKKRTDSHLKPHASQPLVNRLHIRRSQ
jgi:hypothetical protein